MKKKILIFLFIFFVARVFSQIELKLITWNIQDLGRTKNDTEIILMAKILKDFDIVAIQEVVAKDPAGAQAVARLADELNRLGSKWDYVVSEPTKSPSGNIAERYAFLWKTSRVKAIGRGRLVSELREVVYREPFLMQFRVANDDFYILNLHARTYNIQPELEIAEVIDFMKTLLIPSILAGDFNTSEANSVFKPLYIQNYKSVVLKTPTTLKKKCYTGKYRNHAIDNIFVPTFYFSILKAGIIDFVQDCDNLEETRQLSDHLPVFVSLTIKKS